MGRLITESIVLPSAATHMYGPEFDGQVTLRAMTTDEERARLSAQSFYQTMSYIINECIVDNKKPDGTYKIDSAIFTDFDFFAIMVKLRIMSYGKLYKTVAICPKCGHQFTYKADLSELLYDLVPEDFVEPYEIGPLPSSGDTLGCRFLRIKDRIDVEKKKNIILAKNPNYVGDPIFNLEMEKRIVSANGNDFDYVTIKDYVDAMIAMDVVYYQDNIDKYKFGVVRINTIDKCENPLGCDGHPIWAIKVDREFFRPCLDS